jgi:hypothetical protein
MNQDEGIAMFNIEQFGSIRKSGGKGAYLADCAVVTIAQPPAELGVYFCNWM